MPYVTTNIWYQQKNVKLIRVKFPPSKTLNADWSMTGRYFFLNSAHGESKILRSRLGLSFHSNGLSYREAAVPFSFFFCYCCCWEQCPGLNTVAVSCQATKRMRLELRARLPTDVLCKTVTLEKVVHEFCLTPCRGFSLCTLAFKVEKKNHQMKVNGFTLQHDGYGN